MISTGEGWQASANLTPAAGGAHLCYFHKASENLQLGVELEGSLRTQECTTTIGYQLEIPTANLTFRGEFVACESGSFTIHIINIIIIYEVAIKRLCLFACGLSVL